MLNRDTQLRILQQIADTGASSIKQLEKASWQSVSGGDINQAYHLRMQAGDYFVKLNKPEFHSNFEAESFALDIIARTGAIRVPKVIAIGSSPTASYLVLEFLSISSRGDPKELARALAQMHRVKASRFGFEQNNFIGSTPQFNAWTDRWQTFLIEQRLKPQVKMLGAEVRQGLKKQFERLYQRIPEYFSDKDPTPGLVHGDLWQGNYGFDESGRPVIFDPAAYFGDYEVDLAMMELFASPGTAFFSEYRRHLPVTAGYQRRKTLYNLYHILNHANLFGGSYLSRTESMLSQLLDN